MNSATISGSADCDAAVERRRDAPRLHHPGDEAVELGQRLGRCVDDERLERGPLRLPLVPVEAWFHHPLVLARRGRL